MVTGAGLCGARALTGLHAYIYAARVQLGAKCDRECHGHPVARHVIIAKLPFDACHASRRVCADVVAGFRVGSTARLSRADTRY